MKRALFIAGLITLSAIVPLLAPSESTPDSAIRFADVAGEAGIRAQIVCGGSEKKWIPEANGSGCAALDYDNDGWLDLLIVNGSTMDRLPAIVAGQTPAPYKPGI